MYKFSAKKYLNANFKNPKLEPFIGSMRFQHIWNQILMYFEQAELYRHSQVSRNVLRSDTEREFKQKY